MICRLCLRNCENGLQIFNARRNIVEIIEKHFWFKIDQNDLNTSVICRNCWKNVNDFHQFYIEIEESHKVYESTLPIETVKIEFDICNSDECDDVIKCENEENNPLQQIEQISNNNLAENGCKFNRSGTSSEIINVVDTDHEHDFEFSETQTEICEMNTDDFVNDCDESSKSDDDDDADESYAPIEPIKETKRKRCKTESSAKCSEPKKIKRQINSLEDQAVIRKHIQMACNLCAHIGEDFSELVKHFQDEHKSEKAFVLCCGRKFRKRAFVLQHAYMHENPEYYKCDQCDKSFSGAYNLRSHQTLMHSPDNLRFGCDQCSKKFARQYPLELHKATHIPIHERKFYCEQCPHAKPFGSDNLLQLHISMRHKKATNVCHVCAKEIRDKQSFEKHVRLHFEDSGPRLKCPRPDCDRWLKDEENLRHHLKRHAEEGKDFACTKCDKVCKTRGSLRSHLRYAHCTETFICEICDKSFKQAITLKEHMAQHTGESLYNCTFCTRTFNSNANMHSHKKKMHPIEWDLWRRTKGRMSRNQMPNKADIDDIRKMVDIAKMLDTC